jgi:hypothetical protein
LLAVGRKRGFACFGADTDAYLASLAPLLAFALVFAGLVALHTPLVAATLFLLFVCQVLAPAVIAEALCRWWDRTDRWALYANILNWAPFLFFMALSVVMAIAGAVVQAGAPAEGTAKVSLLLFYGYVIWFQWFVARGALNLSRRRAAILVGCTFLFGFVLFVILAIFGQRIQQFILDMKPQ